MKNFLIFLVFTSTLLYQASGAPEHFLVETEDGHEEPRIDEDSYWSDDFGETKRLDKDFHWSGKYCLVSFSFMENIYLKVSFLMSINQTPNIPVIQLSFLNF